MQDETIFSAIAAGNVEAVRELLSRDKRLANCVDDRGWTPLMHVAMLEGGAVVSIVQLLVEAGAEINAIEFYNGDTALHIACKLANTDFIIALQSVAKHKVYYYVNNFAGVTAIHIARTIKPNVLLPLLARGRFRKITQNDHDSCLAVVGVGPAGAALFISLITNLMEWKKKLGDEDLMRRFAVVLVDRHKWLGTGTPYSEELNSPTSLLNIAAAGMSINAKVPMDFVDWLQEKYNQGTLAELLGPACEYGLRPATAEPGGYYPRLVYGQYVRERVSQWAELAQNEGLAVWELPSSSVDREELGNQHAPIVLHVSGEKIRGTVQMPVTHVYYATGHWEEKSSEGPAYKTAPGYIAFPANVKTLEAKGLFDKPCNISLLGSSLSAIDAIYSVLLHPAVGKLIQKGDCQYEYVLNDKDWKVTAYSRRGLLPRVRPRFNKDWDMRYLSPKEIHRLQYSKRDRHISIEEVIDLLNREFSAAFERQIDVRREADPLKFNQKMQEFGNPFDIVAHDLKLALLGDGRTGDTAYVRWYQVMHALFPVIRIIYRQFTPQERHEFDNKYNSQFLWAFAPMPDSSAAVLLAMHEAGALDVFPIEERTRPEATDSGFIMSYRDHEKNLQQAFHPFLIGTAGLANMFYNDISDLTQYMISNRQVRLYDPVNQSEEREGSIFITDDGSFEILDESGDHSFHRRGVGFFLHSQLFDVQAVPSVVNYGKRVAEIYAEEFVYSKYGPKMYDGFNTSKL